MRAIGSHFEPLAWLRNGHLQTLAGYFLPRPRLLETARQHIVPLADGDAIVLHEDSPAAWQPGDRAALLIHGLSGSHASPYMRRIATKLMNHGVRSYRMDLRGCGAGRQLARWPYHSGRSPDAAAALDFISQQCPGSPITLVGFSLGGNIALKLLGEFPESVHPAVDRGMAVNPPIDLAACVAALARGINRYYDRYFVRLLLRDMEQRRALVPDLVTPTWRRPPRGMGEFDDTFTAPVCGFGTAARYYAACSSNQFLHRIRVPTLILTAADDPLVPSRSFAQASVSEAVTMQITPRGGHLGFIGRTSAAHGISDSRWMDWRVMNWTTALSIHDK